LRRSRRSNIKRFIVSSMPSREWGTPHQHIHHRCTAGGTPEAALSQYVGSRAKHTTFASTQATRTWNTQAHTKMRMGFIIPSSPWLRLLSLAESGAIRVSHARGASDAGNGMLKDRALLSCPLPTADRLSATHAWRHSEVLRVAGWTGCAAHFRLLHFRLEFS
jgi:hypothetical protein